MKKETGARILLACIVCICLVFTARSQQNEIRLIVRGDDMGYTHSGNQALIKSYREGIQKSIEVIVPSPWFPEAVKLLNEHPGVDVGVHIALTSEWDNLKWRPLTDCRSLRDSNGYFFPMVYPNASYPGNSISENKPDLKDIEMEMRAQIETAIKYIPRISHISGHMGCTFLNADVRALVKRLTSEYNLLSEADLSDVRYLRLGNLQASSSKKKIEVFLNALDTLKPGHTYIFVEHPGLDNDELRAVHHIGYENVASDRQGITDLFTSEKVKKKIAARKIKLISYRDVRRQ